MEQAAQEEADKTAGQATEEVECMPNDQALDEAVQAGREVTPETQLVAKDQAAAIDAPKKKRILQAWSSDASTVAPSDAGDLEVHCP